MNIIFRTLSGVVLCAVIILGLCCFLLVSYFNHSEQITTSYPTLAAAQEDIQKGWIPPILPPSSYAIRDSHNLDVNTGAGSFSFGPKDIAFFTQHGVVPMVEADKDTELIKLQAQGYKLGMYRGDEKSKWLLAVNESGKGYYWLEYERK